MTTAQQVKAVEPAPARRQPRSKPLRAAVIGGGVISDHHLRFLAGSAEAELAAVCDLSPAVAEFARDRFGAGVAMTDHRRMLEEERPEVVHVLTPPATHVEVISDCLRAGAHVISEKPVAPTHGEFLELWSLARERGVELMEDHNYRFNEPVLAVERLLEDGRLGEVREVEVRMALGIREAGHRYADGNIPHSSHRMPAGILHEFITHLAYLALHFMPAADDPGREFDRMAAQWSNHGGPGEAGFRFDDLDAQWISGGAHGRVRFTAWSRPEELTVTVRGSEGTAVVDLFQPHVALWCRRSGPDQLAGVMNQWVNGWSLVRDAVRNLWNKIGQKTPYEGMERLLGRTYRALMEGEPLPVTFDQMDRASRLIDQLVERQGEQEGEVR